MSKQEQFLWIVQTTILANSGNVVSQPDHADKFRHTASASGVIFTISQALWASGRIPEEMPADIAASEFCYFMLENLRTQGAECPTWFAGS